MIKCCGSCDRWSPVIWLSSLALFGGSLAFAATQLPDQVATHFGLDGAPDAWMERSRHLMLFGLFGVGFSSLFVVLFYVIRFLPPSLLNVSNPEYWRSPDHFPAACRFLLAHSYVVATMGSGFVTGINLLLIEANRTQPARLEAVPAIVLAGGFLFGTFLWCLKMFRFFRNVPADRVPAHG